MSIDRNQLGLTAYQLRALMNEGVIASIFTDDENPDDFIAGYIRMVSTRETMVESVSPYGLHDGWYVIRNTCINELAYDALYSDRLELLMKLNPSPKLIMGMPDSEEDYTRHALTWAKEHGRVVTVWTHSDSLIGFVSSADDLRVTIDVLDFMGRNPVPATVNTRDIELLSVGSEEERMYESLNSYMSVEDGSNDKN